MKEIFLLKNQFDRKTSLERRELIRKLFNNKNFLAVYCIIEESIFQKDYYEKIDPHPDEIFLRLTAVKVLAHYGCNTIPRKLLVGVFDIIANDMEMHPRERFFLILLCLSAYFDLSLYDEVIYYSKMFRSKLHLLSPYQRNQMNILTLLSNLYTGNNVVKELETEFETIEEGAFKEFVEYELIYFFWEYGERTTEDIIELCKRKAAKCGKFSNWFHLLVAEIFHERSYLKNARNYFLQNVDIESFKNIREFYFKRIPLIRSICFGGESIEDEIMLRTFPYDSHLDLTILNSYYTPKNNHQKLPPITAVRKKYINEVCLDIRKNHKRGIWLINNGNSIALSEYDCLKNFENTLDLCSGLLITDKNVKILSRARTILLYCILSSGPLGVSEIFLAEKIFFEENIFLKSATLRVRDLVTQVQKMGLPIIRKDKMIYFDLSQWKFPIIMPFEYRFESEFHFFALFCENNPFDWQLVTKVFGVKRSNAFLMLQKWNNAGLIKKLEETSRGKWIKVPGTFSGCTTS